MEQANGKRMTDSRQTHFGFQTVDEDQKAGMVHQVFSSVASRYDVMNDLMSVGIHRIWKTALMDWLAPRSGQHLLDVAGGTGDVAFRFLDRAPQGRVTVCDMTESMLVEGRKRAEAAEKADRLSWVTGDAMALRRQQLRPLYDQLRHPQRDTDRRCPGRGLPRPASRRPADGAGVQPDPGAGDAMGL